VFCSDARATTLAAVPATILGSAIEALREGGVDPAALGLAWARALPAAILVPAFGLRALPLPARAVVGLALAASIYPALAPSAVATTEPWVVAAAGEALRGLPVAIAAAVPLWAATMAGGVADALRGANEQTSAPTVEGQPTPLGVPFALLAATLFLGTGGPARVATVLAVRPFPAHPFVAISADLSAGITVAVALAAPLLAASIVVEVAAALVARAATPAYVHAVIAPLRTVAILGVLAVVFERIAGVMTRVVAAAP
jgi:type III secretory pathway component EscT